jgi:hypothetical protein
MLHIDDHEPFNLKFEREAKDARDVLIVDDALEKKKHEIKAPTFPVYFLPDMNDWAMMKRYLMPIAIKKFVKTEYYDENEWDY